ncbi:hypothetical protein CLV56_2637 [Mumia flava]|uniref:N-acetyltransferase domain-containing protein n=1 Tax=Mumia flava TaxID=1348852 RepID=A0A2M9BKC1_9ACTN|nr:GNAT family N-acetyltransferase [Mumia flava]PJJ58386.1 hypothetical protein CLV56_2637 [Mumia flava]
MSVREIDPSDDAALRSYVAIDAADAQARPYGAAWTFEELRVTARRHDPWVEHRWLLATDGGAPVASAHLELPLRDNTDTVWVSLAAVPGTRRMLERLCDHAFAIAADAGRTLVEVQALADGDGQLWGLLSGRGLEVGLVNAHRVLDLPPDRAALARIEDETAPWRTAYELRSWSGACPPDLVEAWAGLRAVLVLEAPSGDHEYEAEDFTPERIRHEEAELVAQQRQSFVTVAVRDGTAIAHSQLIVPGTDPVNAYQWDTIVLPAHRGHRLGLALKARNLAEAAAALEPRRVLHTWNAEDNAPMIAVNEAMGFRLVEREALFRLRL